MSELLKNKTLINWISVLLVVVLGWMASVFVWGVLAPTDDSVVYTHNQQNTAAQSFVYYGRKTAQMDIFGKYIANDTPVEKKTEEVVQTQLNLTLNGVLSATQQSGAYALISEGSGKQKSYTIGDFLPGDAELLEIYATEVILKHNDEKQSLALKKRESVALNYTQKSRAIPKKISNTQNIIRPISPKRASEIRRQAMTNPQSFMKSVLVRPSKNSSGEFEGYVLTATRSGEGLFRELGLEPNDVITEVNGISITNTSQLQTLIGASSYDVTIIRNKTPITLQIDF